MNGVAGGHTFFSKGIFNGCTDCHPNLTSSTSDPEHWGDKRTEIQTLLNNLAASLMYNGLDIMNRNPDAEHNLWASLTTNKYDGYLNIYDPVNNPEGETNNPGGVFKNPSPGNSWTQSMKDYNATLPEIVLTNAQMGSIINFQMCLRNTAWAFTISTTQSIADQLVSYTGLNGFYKGIKLPDLIRQFFYSCTAIFVN
jgi:hypothetical protein